MTRKDFLSRAGGFLGALGLGVLAGSLLVRNQLSTGTSDGSEEDCREIGELRGLCSRCGIWKTCAQPQALSYRKGV